MLARAILDNSLVRLAMRAISRKPSHQDRKERVSRLLSRCTVLSNATCLRRAQTLLSWIDWADDVHDDKQGMLFRDVAATA